MKAWLLPLMTLPLLAAAPPQRGLSLAVPPSDSPLLPIPPTPPPSALRTGPHYQPAPLPNRDVDAPLAPRASNAPSVTPSLFNRSNQYRGEGFSSGSTAQVEQDRRVLPGAGFNLRMPLTGQ